MKKLFCLLAGIFLLCGGAYASTSGEKSSANDPQVVTLTMEFFIGTNQLVYRLTTSSNTYIRRIELFLHNVDIHYWGSSGTEYNATASMLYEDGAGHSEVVPCSLTPYSYVDLSTIRVESDAPEGTVFEFNIIGIPAR